MLVSRYQAYAYRARKQVHLGSFATAEEAALHVARDARGREPQSSTWQWVQEAEQGQASAADAEAVRARLHELKQQQAEAHAVQAVAQQEQRAWEQQVQLSQQIEDARRRALVASLARPEASGVPANVDIRLLRTRNIERMTMAYARLGYLKYIEAGGGNLYFMLIFAFFLLTSGAQLIGQLFVALWSNDATYQNQSLGWYLGMCQFCRSGEVQKKEPLGCYSYHFFVGSHTHLTLQMRCSKCSQVFSSLLVPIFSRTLASTRA